MMDEEMLKEKLAEHFNNLENLELIDSESFKPLYESLVMTLKEHFAEDKQWVTWVNIGKMLNHI